MHHSQAPPAPATTSPAAIADQRRRCRPPRHSSATPSASATTAPEPSTPWLGTWASAATKRGTHEHEQKAEREHLFS